VLVQAENLKTHPAVSAALRRGTLEIFGWIYQFEDGLVRIYDPSKNAFVPSSEVKERALSTPHSLAL
jgi:carbonic anhydrase